MRAIITGGTGFIGRALCRSILDDGWEVVVLSRSPGRAGEIFNRGVISMSWNSGGDWASMMDRNTVVVNLAGESIASGRWTASRMERIRSSRIDAGKAIAEAVSRAETPPAAVIQASAVGYYGSRGLPPVDESALPGSGFLADVCREWEESTRPVEERGVRRAIIRTGVVFGEGGALAQMLPAFRMYLGGPLGTGNQGVSWIHLADQVAAIRFLMEHKSASGAFNLTSPEPVTSEKLAHLLGDCIGRPAKLRVPAFALRLLYGKMADELLLGGQFIAPARLLDLGFKFRFTHLEDALRDILHPA